MAVEFCITLSADFGDHAHIVCSYPWIFFLGLMERSNFFVMVW